MALYCLARCNTNNIMLKSSNFLYTICNLQSPIHNDDIYFDFRSYMFIRDHELQICVQKDSEFCLGIIVLMLLHIRLTFVYRHMTVKNKTRLFHILHSLNKLSLKCAKNRLIFMTVKKKLLPQKNCLKIQVIYL